MSRKRPVVAQLVQTMEVGGAEHLAVQLAGHLAAAGFASHLIVGRGPGPLSRRVAEAVDVHYLEYERASIANPLRFGASVRRGYRKLAGVLRGAGVQILQTHLPDANFWGLAMARTGVCSVVATVHNNQEFRYTESDPWAKVRLRKFAYRQILATCDATVAVSRAVKDSLLAELGVAESLARKIVVVTNGVPVPEKPAADQIERIRGELGVATDVPLLVAAGRLDDQKNFGDLVAAAARLRRREIDFRLIIAGEGPHRSDLERAVAEHGLAGQVSLPGVLDNLVALFQAADLLVFPSLWEGLPLVLLEAMATGLPVVGNDIPGVNEIVRDGVDGRLVPPHDVEAFAEAIADGLGDRPRLARWSANARALVRERYDFRHMGDAIADLYLRLSGGTDD